MKSLSGSLLALLMLAGLSLPTYAQSSAKSNAPPKHEMPEPSKEERSKMATMHEQMATCLRSDKSMDACHEEMRSACKQMGDHCPMMMDHHGMGMMKHHSEKDESK